MSAIAGLLFGWKRRNTGHCLVLTMKVLDDDALCAGDAKRVHLAISDEKLCSLARDLHRAAQERGLIVWPRNAFIGRPVSLLERLLESFARRFPAKPVALLPAPERVRLGTSRNQGG